MLDGGLATELENRGHDLNNPLWSASLLKNQPEEILAVHRAYLNAGADCITAASYQASLPGFMAAGFSESESTALLLKAVDIACQARDQYFEKAKHGQGLRPLVAASVGPYGAYLADGSEFRGNYSISSQELRDFHEPRWKILQATDADLFAIETVPSHTEAVILLELLNESPGLYAWISFSCADGININDGTPLADCAALFREHEQIVAIGANCTAPRYISSLIQQVQIGAPGKEVIVYPNSGEVYDGQQKNWLEPPDPYEFSAASLEWYNLGARLVGGCCRTGPDDIAGVKKSIVNNNSART